MHALALHHDGLSWKIALLSQKDGSQQIELLRTLRQEDKPLEVLKTILFGKTLRIASALAAEQFVLRSVDLDIRGWNHVLKVLPFQVEDLIPFPKEQTVLLAFLEKETAQGSSVRLVATQQNFIEKHLGDLSMLGIDPHSITTTVHALKRWANFAAPQEPSLLLLYVSRESSFATLLLKGEIMAFKTFSWENKGEWRRVKDFLESFLGDSPLPWLTAGEVELLGEEIPSLPVAKQLQEYAIPIGTCLEALARDGKSVEWRQDKLEAPLQAKKRRLKIFSTTALFLACAALLGPFGHFLLNRHQDTLLTRAETVLEKLHIPAKDTNLEDSLELLSAAQEECNHDKQFGPYSPALSSLFLRINQASLSLEKNLLPIVKTLNYRLNALKQPSLEMEWSCPSKESARSLKIALSRMQNLKMTEWRENETLISTTFVIE